MSWKDVQPPPVAFRQVKKTLPLDSAVFNQRKYKYLLANYCNVINSICLFMSIFYCIIEYNSSYLSPSVL